jgi:TRAP-type mannitol/chloroaromatic compound transport system permease large subunit
MNPETLGLIMLAALVVTILVGYPIAFTLIFLGIVFGYTGFGPLVFDLMVLQTSGVMQ